MMTIECAISRAQKCCASLSEIIEANERNWRCMDGKHRDEIGAWRALMYAAGMAKDQLPETPFLDPAHLEAYHARNESMRLARIASKTGE